MVARRVADRVLRSGVVGAWPSAFRARTTDRSHYLIERQSISLSTDSFVEELALDNGGLGRNVPACQMRLPIIEFVVSAFSIRFEAGSDSACGVADSFRSRPVIGDDVIRPDHGVRVAVAALSCSIPHSIENEVGVIWTFVIIDHCDVHERHCLPVLGYLIHKVGRLVCLGLESRRQTNQDCTQNG